ncbi:hypothetical protein HYH03_000183 [Edaphochlamys debaryana]|uniref:Uncharacterized protein n=1 Tax=Edaphochlamys debaryana TaxID=47281 RepID=A0A835YIR3_9CHLO|nr:hypothetical protein HYH03_000183 [Edaphochlamys debaryana]|eukprot:KAG2501681.1 hypothetical protein HYH03_000183 [Edaphochlamys debaryana]
MAILFYDANWIRPGCSYITVRASCKPSTCPGYTPLLLPPIYLEPSVLGPGAAEGLFMDIYNASAQQDPAGPSPQAADKTRILLPAVVGGALGLLAVAVGGAVYALLVSRSNRRAARARAEARKRNPRLSVGGKGGSNASSSFDSDGEDADHVLHQEHGHEGGPGQAYDSGPGGFAERCKSSRHSAQVRKLRVVRAGRMSAMGERSSQASVGFDGGPADRCSARTTNGFWRTARDLFFLGGDRPSAILGSKYASAGVDYLIREDDAAPVDGVHFFQEVRPLDEGAGGRIPVVAAPPCVFSNSFVVVGGRRWEMPIAPARTSATGAPQSFRAPRLPGDRFGYASGYPSVPGVSSLGAEAPHPSAHSLGQLDPLEPEADHRPSPGGRNSARASHRAAPASALPADASSPRTAAAPPPAPSAFHASRFTSAPLPPAGSPLDNCPEAVSSGAGDASRPMRKKRRNGQSARKKAASRASGDAADAEFFSAEPDLPGHTRKARAPAHSYRPSPVESPWALRQGLAGVTSRVLSTIHSANASFASSRGGSGGSLSSRVVSRTNSVARMVKRAPSRLADLLSSKGGNAASPPLSRRGSLAPGAEAAAAAAAGLSGPSFADIGSEQARFAAAARALGGVEEFGMPAVAAMLADSEVRVEMAAEDEGTADEGGVMRSAASRLGRWASAAAAGLLGSPRRPASPSKLGPSPQQGEPSCEAQAPQPGNEDKDEGVEAAAEEEQQEEQALEESEGSDEELDDDGPQRTHSLPAARHPPNLLRVRSRLGDSSMTAPGGVAAAPRAPTVGGSVCSSGLVSAASTLTGQVYDGRPQASAASASVPGASDGGGGARARRPPHLRMLVVRGSAEEVRRGGLGAGGSHSDGGGLSPPGSAQGSPRTPSSLHGCEQEDAFSSFSSAREA